MAFDDFRKKLETPDSPEHVALLRHVKGLIDISRGDMCQNYSTWDEHDEVFHAYRKPDKEDRASAEKGQPKKMIVPLTFSQIMTFVAFSIMSITQNRRFFELEPTGTEDNPLEEPMELILERDLRKNQWSTFLVEFFLDIGRFGLAAAEVCYVEENRMIRVAQEEPVTGAFGVESTKKTNAFQKIPVFLGNKVYSISPYRFFPDTRIPRSRYQEGEFCGSEDEFSLAGLQSQGPDFFNLDKIKKFTLDDYTKRRDKSRVEFIGPANRENPNLGGDTDTTGKQTNMVKSGPVCVTKCVFDIKPKNFKVGDSTDSPLGDEDFPVRYLCWYANDQTIIRFEEFYCLHFKFPYIMGQYLPDKQTELFMSLSDVCDQLTNLVTWKINTHLASQKNSVESRYIVDPAGIDMASLESRSPYIKMKRAASQQDVRRYITQFKTEDVTAGVFQDVAFIENLVEKVSGWSAQMQGQYSQGRRSATQDRVVAQGAGARGKTTLSSIWDTAFEPLGKQLIANNRQEMDEDTFNRIMGTRTWPMKSLDPAQPTTIDPATGQAIPAQPMPYTTSEIFTMFKSDPIGIATSEDFFVFDGTLPSEKAFLAQSLQEIWMSLITNPVVAQIMGYGPAQMKELLNQIYLLRGVTPARLPSPSQNGPIVDPDAGQQPGAAKPDQSTPLREIVSIKLPDLSGDERTQALSRIGIKSDPQAHASRLKLENPAPTASKSNGTRS